MRKSLWIFLLAVLIPSAVLGWLALRSAEEQKIILERRTAELYQRETEAVAATARAVVDEQRRGFGDAVRHLLTQHQPDSLARDFSAQLPQAWPVKAVGFVIGEDGRMLSPSPRAAAGNAEWQRFLWDQGAFLGGDIAATVYTVPVESLNQPESMRRQKLAFNENALGNTNVASNYGARNAQGGAAPKAAPRKAEESKSDSIKAEASKGDFFAVKKAAPSQSANERDVLEMKLKFQAQDKVGTKEKEPAAPSMAPPQSAVASRSVSPAPKPGAARASGGLAGFDTPREEIAGGNVQAPSASQAPQNAVPQVTTPAFDGNVQFKPAGQSDSANRESKDSESAQDADLRQRSDVQTQLRQVQPQQLFAQKEQAAWSSLAPETTAFSALCRASDEGIVTRFVQDKLALIFWTRPAQSPHLVFGCMVDAAELAPLLKSVMPEPRLTLRGAPEFVLAVLDDKVRPMATTPANDNSREWNRPFVASEIGEALPHWEAALYLMRPEQIQESAIGLRRTIVFLVVALLSAIAIGAWLVIADARRQFALAQQKTDFVSNVSHELKTPLTSIRMFAELMLGGRAEIQPKTPQYLRIIMVEAERLTRLINNVLDFAKLERRQKRFDKKPLDLHAMIERVWESHEIHLQECGFTTKWQAAAPPYPVVGDEDAFAQILVNLLSNAEKYCGERKEIDLHTYYDDHHICVAVLDRGPGVPTGEERKIFEAFYRAHDSLSSGIQGSGLGLTLALRLAEEHGGTIEYRAREGGGSAFTFKLPTTGERTHA